MAGQSIFILDGMALMYRAFYAFINSPMRNSEGMNTSAMFGFANTLISLIEKEKPSHIVACLDPSGPTFRHEQYKEYKANRQAMPQELRDSIPWIIEIIEAMKIPLVRIPKYEADDLIGTFTRMSDEAGLASYIVSQDKDLGQLLSPLCSFWKPGRKGSEFEIISEADFLAEWSIERPMQIIDVLALMGDASDNIPGVPGVGAVTAKKLVAQFGGVKEILEHSSEIKGKLREKIENNADSARLSYELATICRDVPVEISIEECRWDGFDPEKWLDVMTRLEFKFLAKKMIASSSSAKSAKAPKAADGDAGTAAEDGAASAKADSSALAKSALVDESGQMQLFEQPELADINSTRHHYILVESVEEREALAARLLASPRWAFDTETTGLDPLMDKLLGMSFCLKEAEAYYVPVPFDFSVKEAAAVENLELFSTEEEQEESRLVRDLSELAYIEARELCVAPFRAALASSAQKIGVNLKFDLQVMSRAEVPIAGPYFDAMLAHGVLHPLLRHGMDDMAESLLNYKTIRLEEVAGKSKDTRAVPLDVMCRYAAEDADVSLRLADVLKKQLKKQGLTKLMDSMEFPLLAVLASMEEEGMRVDLSQLEASSAALAVKIDIIRTGIEEEVGRPINLNSPKQLGELLFGEMKLVEKPKKTRTGQFVTDEETLRKLVPISPLVGNILEYREMSKLKGTYLDALPRFISPYDGRIHASLMQMVTATGRLACQSPNLQNIPVRSDAGKLIRHAFVARNEDYSIMSADYSQVELRIMAALSGDPSMIAAFREGRDIHSETAARIFNCAFDEVTSDMRRSSKMVNFGIIYGISAFGLSQRLDCPRAHAAELIDNYFAQFPLVKTFMDTLISEARERGYAETLCGRRRDLPDLTSSNFNLRNAAERTAINTPIQGSAADMIKIAMLRVHELLKGRRSRLIMQVHDELLIDLHHEEKEELMPLIVDAMRNALPLPHDVPLDVEAQSASNWLDAH